MASAGTEQQVTKQNITSSVTGSAVVLPKDQYSITALVSGDVISANFEQGDMVNEGDVLYQIDSSDAKKLDIEIADATVTGAKVFNDPTLAVTYSNNEDWSKGLGQGWIRSVSQQ